MKFTHQELKELIRKEFDYENKGIDITHISYVELGERWIVYWVADEVGYLGECAKNEIWSVWKSDKEDSLALELMTEILETVWKYEDLSV